jgi:hypothetical protein
MASSCVEVSAAMWFVLRPGNWLTSNEAIAVRAHDGEVGGLDGADLACAELGHVHLSSCAALSATMPSVLMPRTSVPSSDARSAVSMPAICAVVRAPIWRADNTANSAVPSAARLVGLYGGQLRRAHALQDVVAQLAELQRGQRGHLGRGESAELGRIQGVEVFRGPWPPGWRSAARAVASCRVAS